MELLFKYPSKEMFEKLSLCLDSLKPSEMPSSFWKKIRVNRVLKKYYDTMSLQETKDKLELWLYYDYAVALRDLDAGQYCGFRGYWLRDDAFYYDNSINTLEVEHQMRPQSNRSVILYGPTVLKLRPDLFTVTDYKPDDENYSLEVMLPFMNEIKEKIQHGEWINPFDEVIRLLFGKAEDLDNPSK